MTPNGTAGTTPRPIQRQAAGLAFVLRALKFALPREDAALTYRVTRSGVRLPQWNGSRQIVQLKLYKANLLSQLAQLLRLAGEMQLAARGEPVMRDILLVLSTVGFFVLSIAYVRFCDRVK